MRVLRPSLSSQFNFDLLTNGALIPHKSVHTVGLARLQKNQRYLRHQIPNTIAQRSGLIEPEIISQPCWYLP